MSRGPPCTPRTGEVVRGYNVITMARRGPIVALGAVVKK